MMNAVSEARRNRALSLQQRITAAIVVTAVAVLCIGCGLFMVEQDRTERATLQRAGVDIAEIIAASDAVRFAHSAPNPSGTGDLFPALRPDNSVQWVQIRTGRGNYLARYGSVRRLGGESLIAHAPILEHGVVFGEVRVSVARPASAILLPRYLALGGALFFCAIALALFLGRWLAGRITDPVARLSQTMDEVGRSGDFERRVEPLADDEIGLLTESFNSLLARLHENDSRLRQTMSELTVARDAAQAASVQKSQFLANMSHEIRTPLNGVLAMAQIMELSELAPEQRDRLQTIRRSGEALLEILNDILDVSKIEAGKFELEVVDFDLDELVSALQASFSGLAERKDVSFSVELAETARGRRRGDAVRLRQILSNFVSNAIKFTQDGDVRVTIADDVTLGQDGVHIAVADTGIGIAPEHISLLFQKFSQVDASSTRKFGGTGLGLAISHELASLMGGRVWVDSVVGEGSTFHAVVPLPRIGAQESEPDEHSEPAAEMADQPALRVLAAEDNETNQLVLTTIMQIFGCELTLAGNGHEAIAAWEQETFDVVLMDVQMPGMDGIAATRAIRAAELSTGRTRTPIIALSANALTHQVEEYMAAGMDGHVAKPIELPKLQVALEIVLQANEAAEAA